MGLGEVGRILGLTVSWCFSWGKFFLIWPALEHSWQIKGEGGDRIAVVVKLPVSIWVKFQTGSALQFFSTLNNFLNRFKFKLMAYEFTFDFTS